MNANPRSEDDQEPSGHEGCGEGPLFTVIVPTRDRPRQLAECLDALKALVPPPGGFELVIVDDGSSPAVESSLAESLGFEALVLRRSGNGPGSARNAGAAAARGRYLAFLDDDCRPDSRWLCALEEALLGSARTLLGGQVLNALEGNSYSAASQLLVDYLYEAFDGSSGQFFCSNNLCVPADGFRELGGFDTSFRMPAAEDRDLCVRWAEGGLELRFVPEAIVHHAHAMGLQTFWRQHLRYGQGAHHFNRLRAGRSGERMKIEPLRFYAGLLRYPFVRLPFLRALPIASLFTLAQVANTLGFFRERMSTSESPPMDADRQSAAPGGGE